MPHKSVRRSLGFTPRDLWRDYWHPDCGNIQREKCKVMRREQKILICDVSDESSSTPSQTVSALSSTSPRRWSSFSIIRRLFNKGTRHQSGQATSTEDQLQSNGTPRYLVTGKIYPSDKSRGVFTDVPAGLMPLEPPSICCSDLLRDVQTYLRQRPQRQDWTIKGVLPRSRQAAQVTTGVDGTQKTRSLTANDSLPEVSHSRGAHDQRRFVLLERRIRCNCEESYYPRHRLRITYKPGYTPDPQKIAEAARRAEREDSDDNYRASAAASVAAAAVGAAAVVCAAGC